MIIALAVGPDPADAIAKAPQLAESDIRAQRIRVAQLKTRLLALKPDPRALDLLSVVEREGAAAIELNVYHIPADLLTAILARSRPDALVTDQPQTTTPAYRLVINVSRLDLAIPAGAPDGSANGAVNLDADWLIIPRDASAPTLRDRTHLSAAGPLRDDRDAVAMTTALLDRLAAAIDVTRLR